MNGHGKAAYGYRFVDTAREQKALYEFNHTIIYVDSDGVEWSEYSVCRYIFDLLRQRLSIASVCYKLNEIAIPTPLRGRTLKGKLVAEAALNTSDNLGWTVLILSIIGLVNSLWLGIPLFTRKRSQGRLIPNIILVLLSLLVYANELYHAVNLLRDSGDAGAVYALAGTLQYVYAIGLVRAWELLGVEQIGIGRWLNPLRIISPAQKDTEKPAPDEQTPE